MAFEAVILAGGMGTRIRSVVADRPKVMVDIGGRPFLEILLDRMRRNGVGRVILATGYRHHDIEAHFGSLWGGLQIDYSIEETPLGTGGAVRQALRMAVQNDLFVFNGDTFFDVCLDAMRRFHETVGADVTLALKPMRDFMRYGTVKLAPPWIAGFREKQPTREGLINGGVYLITRQSLARLDLPEKFSLETDLLEKRMAEIRIGGFVSDRYFIDIGVPEDYSRAQRELPNLPEGEPPR